MSFILDASVTIAAISPDEDHPEAVRLLTNALEHGALCPGLWALETANIIGVKVRRGAISSGSAAAIIAMLHSGEITIEPSEQHAEIKAIWSVMLRHSISAYDAAYLSLAISRKLPLATLDKRLAAAAEAEGVILL